MDLLSCKYFSTNEVMKLLGISRPTLYRLIKSGKIPTFKFPGTRRVFIPAWWFEAIAEKGKKDFENGKTDPEGLNKLVAALSCGEKKTT